jgi:hypothetical protein
MTPEQTTEILALRNRGLTPKEIARKLGLRPAEVNAIIQNNGEQTFQDRLARGEIAPIYECLVSADFPDHRFLAAGKARPKKIDKSRGSMGLTMVVVARRERPGKIKLCNYLVDYNCLGVKDVIGPKQVTESDYPQLKSKYYSRFDNGAKKISLEQAQAIVFGSVAYAQVLGLSPHKDFNEAARNHLGVWDEQLTIWCGDEDGKPLYMAGPYDSPTKILGILDQTVGEGNYNFIAPIDMF